jgi:hypothetical protein
MTRTERVRQSEEVNSAAWGYEQETVPYLREATKGDATSGRLNKNGDRDRRLMEFERVMGKTRRKRKKKDETMLLRKRVRVANVGWKAVLGCEWGIITHLLCRVTRSQIGFKLRAPIRSEGKEKG